MSFEDKKINDKEVDELDIKSHLNTSLEAERISVSEDLINRTLAAINNAESEEPIVKKSSIFSSGHIRTLVAVVAAIFVLAVGLNAIRIFVPSGMKSDNSVQEAKDYDMDGGIMKNEEARSENYLFSYGVSEDSKEATMESEVTSAGSEVKDKIDYTTTDNSLGVGTYKSEDIISDDAIEYKADESIPESDNSIVSTQEFELMFIDIAIIDVDAVTSIIITSEYKNEEKVIADKKQIESFYSLMNDHSYQESIGENSDNRYIIDIIGEEIVSHIVIGYYDIVVEHTKKDMVSHNIYKATDQSKLIEDLKELMNR